MQIEGIKVENQVGNHTYLQDAMKRARKTMTEVTMVVMYTDRMHANGEKFTVGYVDNMAEALWN